jgi:hypothetical protein
MRLSGGAEHDGVITPFHYNVSNPLTCPVYVAKCTSDDTLIVGVCGLIYFFLFVTLSRLPVSIDDLLHVPVSETSS